MSNAIRGSSKDNSQQVDPWGVGKHVSGKYSFTLGTRIWHFRNLADLMAKATPATDNVAQAKELMVMMDSVIQRYSIPTQSCVLTHVTNTLEAIEQGAPVDLVFQSIGGTEATNRGFGFDLANLREAQDAARSLKRGSLGQNVMYVETGQGSSLSANAHQGLDQQTCEARAYAVARHFEPLLVNTVVGFIGPEYLFDGKEIIRAGLEDHFCGKLLGVPMGCDICYTNHAEADQNDMDNLLTLLAVAGCTFIMGVPARKQTRAMTEPESPVVTHNPWRRLRQYTDARIGLGRAGVSLSTSELLAFQLAHAQAQDAVHFPLDIEALRGLLEETPAIAALGDALCLHSQAPDRVTYLQRPDLGRCLSQASVASLQSLQQGLPEPPDLALVITDGLSSRAVQQNAVPVIEHFISDLAGQSPELRMTPPLLVEQGRVAIGDEIGHLMGARQVVMLIGERPGLSSPDSLGIYLTYGPEPGLPDARRNCISNIRPAGLSSGQASQRLLYLIQEAVRLKLSGVALKDRSTEIKIGTSHQNSFLL